METCCAICKSEVKENLLPKHVWNRHRLVSERYFIDILGNMPKQCSYCNSQAKFNSIAKGYHKICGSKECETLLRSDSTKESKRKLKLDPVKYNQFKDKTAKAVKKIWEDRSLSGEDTKIREKISISQKKTISEMSVDERSKKFGWMNSPSVSNEKKREVWEMSLGKFHANLTGIDREKYYEYCHKQANKVNTKDLLPEEIKLTSVMNLNLCEYFNLEIK